MQFSADKAKIRTQSGEDSGIKLGKNLEVVIDASGLTDEVVDAGVREFLTVALERKRPFPFEIDLANGAGALVMKPEEVKIDTAELDDAAWGKNKEAVIAEKLPSAHKGYSDVITALNSGRKRKEQLAATSEEAMQTEFEAWFTPDKLDQYEAINPGIEYDVIATPNVKVTKKDLYRTAEAFGKDQRYATYLNKDFLDKYSDEELSGTDPDSDNAIVFSLVPKEYTPDLELDVEDQVAALEKFQVENPDAKVPSVLEAVTRWYTLRAQCKDNVSDVDLTYIRHFDLDPKRLDVWSYVPYSCVYGVGEPRVDRSDVGSAYDGRVSVG